MDPIVILTGLAASLAWGGGDFAGGLASRRAAAARVVLASQLIGTAALVALGLIMREPIPPAAAMLNGLVGGLGGGLGVLLFFMSMARGKMGLAAPLTAVASGGIPLMVGLLTEGLPGPTQSVGFLLALAALWVISRPDGDEPVQKQAILLPLLAGIGFGIFLTAIGRIDPNTGFVWPLVAARIASMTMMIAVILLGRGNTANERDGGTFPWGLAALAGVGDTAGNILFVISSQMGRLDVAAVLGSFYPAVTALLAVLLLQERLSIRQTTGVVMALVAVVLIAL